MFDLTKLANFLTYLFGVAGVGFAIYGAMSLVQDLAAVPEQTLEPVYAMAAPCRWGGSYPWAQDQSKELVLFLCPQEIER